MHMLSMSERKKYIFVEERHCILHAADSGADATDADAAGDADFDGHLKKALQG